MSGADGRADPGARPRWRWDVALSFSSAQRDYVEQVAQVLKARGVRCFYDADQQIELWGKPLAEVLPAIYGEQAAVVVMFVSAEYAARDWPRHERRAALAGAVRERREYVLPARFDDTPLPGLLPDVSYINLRRCTPQQFAAMIVAKLAALGITAPMSSANEEDPTWDVEEARRAGAVHAAETDLRRLGVHEFDVDALVALSHPVAASELTQMPHHRAASVLGRAPVGASAQVLNVLLLENEGLAVLLLAAISRDRAKQIIDAMTVEGEWLKDLPTAAKAIEDCERRDRRERGLLGEKVGPLAHAALSKRHTEGYYQSFKNGLIHWSARGGAQATTGEICEYHVARGGSGSQLGFPLTPEMDAARSSPFETDGRCQRFESRWDYGRETCQRLGLVCGATVYWSKHGAHATWGGIGEYYEAIGGTNGPLGFPVTDEAEIGPTERKAGDGAIGCYQCFEGGTVYWSEKTKAVAVHSPVADYLDRNAGLGFPVSPMIKAATNERFGTEGSFQRFEAWEDYPEDILNNWSDSEGPGGATIYTSDTHGTHCVGWGNGVLYERLGGTSSWLGFPESDETVARMSEDEPRSTIQEFEGGAIFFKEGHGSVPVSGAIREYISQHGGLRQQLGFPVKEARSLVSEEGEQVQFFEHGIVTFRNDIIEAWIRPEK